MPPAAVRRPVTVTLSLIVALALLAAGPVLLLLAGLARLLGRRKPLIAVALVLHYCLRELGVLAACAALWCLAAGGRLTTRPLLQRLHWRLLRWFVHGLASHALSLTGARIDEDCPSEARALIGSDTPVIVLGRHAGPGDTVLLIDHLMSRYGRRPSVVLRQAITLDPAIDLLVSRLPHGAIDNTHRDGSQEVIESLAAGLGPGGALLLYPEGGNFSTERRRSALASLRRKGRHRAAAAAQQMSHVLPPRPTGVLAALRGNPDAGVVVVAHTGLGLAAYPRQIYRELPLGRTLRLRMWLVDRADIPATEDGQVAWLNRWWKNIDEWVEAQPTGPDELTPKR